MPFRWEVSAAARALGYTQPAVSHHIARLEAEVGTAVITRLGRGVRLTDAGLALVEHTDAVLTRLTAAEEDIAAIAGLRAGRVRLVTFPSGSATLMAGRSPGYAWRTRASRCRSRRPSRRTRSCSCAPATPTSCCAEIAYATDDYVTVQSLVAADLGVTLQPALALVAARRDDVAVRPLAGDPVRTVEVVMSAAERRPPALLAMLAARREASAALAATPEAAALGIRAA